MLLSETDTIAQWNDSNDNIDVSAESLEECSKVATKNYKSKDLTPGLFVACCPHTICYGYHMMLVPEGRKDLLKVLYERIPMEELQNLTVMYDFACNAAEYITLREPKLFATTRFVIDRFHSVNHKCSSFWKLTSYPGFADLVSTASESLNSFLTRFSSQCAYMKQETYIKFLNLMFAVCNWLVNMQLQQKLSWVDVHE